MFISRIVVLAIAVVGACLSLGAPTQAAAATPTRVLLIPGQYVGATPFGPMAQNLTARGYPTTVLDLKGFDLRSDAAAISRAVDRELRTHPGSRVALVGHSIGAMSARWYLKRMGGTDKIATYVSIGSPQYGSGAACAQDVGREVCPGNAFLTEINRGDDTPGPTRYYTIRSAREYATGALDGGQCRVTPIPANESLPMLGLEHTVEPLDPRIWDATAASLSGRCAGRFVSDTDGALNYRRSLLPGAPGYRP